MKISTSTKFLGLLSVCVLIGGTALGSHYYDHQEGYSVTGDTGFSIPEYNSQSELATELIAPFLFIVILMKFAFERVLEFTLVGNNDRPNPWDDSGENVSREATLMAIAVTGMMIPTPFWSYVRTVASSLALVATSAVLLVLLFLIYSFFRG